MHQWESHLPSQEPKGHLFRLTNLQFRYADGPQALSGIDLEIAADDRIALVGQNGSGKTTLIKQLCGLLLPDAGNVSFKGQDLRNGHLERSRLEIGILFQDPDDQLFGHTVIDDVAFGPSNQGLASEDARQVAQQALQRVHLADKAYQAPHRLSFGQKKRAALAGLLATNPAVLLLDEPTTNIDPRQEQVFLDLLAAFKGTLVCVSHDLLFLYELCRRAVVMENGSIAHDYAMNDLVAQRSELRSHGLDFSFRLMPIDNGEKNGGPAETRLAEAQRESASAPPMLELRGYHFRYPDGTRALTGIDLSVPVGERIAMVGENGAGKTTLLACLLGLLEGNGTYLFEGRPVTRRIRRDLWRNIGMVFQDSADQLFCPSVGEEVSFGLKQLGVSKNEIRERTQEALSLVHLKGFEQRVPLHMSGGERKRLALACVLAMSPRLLILDEPSAGLDPQGEEQLLSILGELDVTLLMVSHDMFFVDALTRRTVVMHRGSIIQDLPTDAFFKDSRLSNLNGLAYSFRQRCGKAIRELQHQHEHSHHHRHLHAHPHEHDDVVHDHLHKHDHAHRHRFLHSHPGEEQEHRHASRQYHDHPHAGEHGVHDHNHNAPKGDHKHSGEHGPHDHDHTGHDKTPHDRSHK
ncbi:MAG: ATP-binding cassette domain-containing protein [Desulfosarcina sp.]|nr:ATP-binding cassette domain-containing protein [Desulfosarcina sp.]